MNMWKLSYKWLSLAFYLIPFTFCSGQSFEGTLNLHMTTPQAVTYSILTVKDGKTLRIIRLDSIESIKLIKDGNKETSVLLRQRDDLKYGFKANTILPKNPLDDITADESKLVVIESTGITEKMENKICTKIRLRSPYATAEAWITNDMSGSLSHYFSEFLGPKTDPHLYSLRKAAEQEGFVMKYQETLTGLNQTNNVELFLIENEISPEVFDIEKEYQILNESEINTLSADADKSPSAKKKLEEFTNLFGIR